MPDPSMHIPQAYALATGQAFNTTEKQVDDWGNTVRRQALRGDPFYLNPQGTNLLVSQILSRAFSNSQSTDHGNPSPEPKNGYYRSTQYFPAAYIPQAIGLRIGLWSKLSNDNTLQLARAVNFITYISLLGCAIFISPRGKIILTLVGLLPASVFMASSIMPDGLYIAVSSLIVALICRLLVDRNAISRSVFIVIVACSLWLLFSKVLYVIIALPLLLLPQNIIDIKKKISYSILLLASLILYLWWSAAYSGGFYAVNQKSNISNISLHPFTFCIMVTSNALKSTRNLAELPTVYTILFIIIITTIVAVSIYWLVHDYHECQNNSNAYLTLRYALIAATLFFIGMCAIYAFIALTWNNLADISIKKALQGLQGRYILPYIPLALFACVWRNANTSANSIQQRAITNIKVGDSQ